MRAGTEGLWKPRDCSSGERLPVSLSQVRGHCATGRTALDPETRETLFVNNHPVDGDLYQLDSGYYCAGIVIAEGRVVRAAPILKWTVGKEPVWLVEWCRNRSITIRHVASAVVTYPVG